MLWLMSMCDDFIIANSTYSWWGAWLSNRGTVIVPNIWFGGWDIANENVYEISIRSEVLDKNLLNELKSDLEAITI